MATSKAKLRGFFRLQLVDKDTRKIVGDSGWKENVVTRDGLNGYVGCMIATDSKQALWAVIATQSTVVNSTHDSLTGTENTQVTVTPSVVNYGTGRLTCSFDGTDNSDTVTIGTIGLHSNTNVSVDLLSGQTYTTSDFATNQDLNMTYELQLS